MVACCDHDRKSSYMHNEARIYVCKFVLISFIYNPITIRVRIHTNHRDLEGFFDFLGLFLCGFCVYNVVP